jgi:hypothetical protein
MDSRARYAVRTVSSLAVALAAALVLSASVSAASAVSTRVNVPAVTKQLVHRIGLSSGVPVLLPDRIVIRGLKVKAYAGGAAFRRGWTIDLGYTASCNGANACAMASFYAERGGSLEGRSNVTLTRGVRARFRPMSCGASCDPPSIAFAIGGVSYVFSIKDPATRPKSALIEMANEAIGAGAR